VVRRFFFDFLDILMHRNATTELKSFCWTFLIPNLLSCAIFFGLLLSGRSPSALAFEGTYGYTAVFAFSGITGQHGWGWHSDPDIAANEARKRCGKDAEIICYQKDGYLALVWDQTKFAYGHSSDSLQEAYDSAVTEFRHLHNAEPTLKKVISSDGHVYSAGKISGSTFRLP